MISDVNQLSSRWTRRPLCRRYATAVFSRAACVQSRAVWWALGTLNDGESEILGVWESSDENPLLPSEVFGQLHDRGVVSIRYCIGDLAGGEATFKQKFRHAGVVGSVEAALARLCAPAADRHRAKLAARMRAAAEAEELKEAQTELAALRDSELGKKYPEIVRQWNEALAGFETLFALDAPLQALIRSADRTAAGLNEGLSRAMRRERTLTDAAAFDFAVAWLAKAERGLDRALAAQLNAGASAHSPRAGLSAAGAPSVLTLA